MGGQGSRESLRWPAAGCVLAHAYMGEAGTGMCGHAHTMGEWVAAKAAGEASGVQWQATSWRHLVRAYAGRAGAGMRIPWRNGRARWQREPQVGGSQHTGGFCASTLASRLRSKYSCPP